MKKSLLWLLVVAISLSMIAVFSITGCKEAAPAAEEEAVPAEEEVAEETTPAEEEPAEEEATEEVTEEKFIVAFSTLQTADPANMQRIQGMETFFKEEGVEFEVASADIDINKQMADIEGFISKKVDAIIIQALDSVALGSVVADANKAGIPVILDDISVEGCEYFAFVHSDHYKVGVIPAEEMVKRMNEEGKVVYLHYPMITSCRDREAGWDAVFSQYPDIEVVDRKLAGTSDTNIAAVEDFLQAYPDLKGICCVNDQVALDALGVVEEKGKEGQVMIIGGSGIPDAVEKIKAGSAFIATADQQGELEGKVCAEMALAAIRGEEISLKEIVIPVKLITK